MFFLLSLAQSDDCTTTFDVSTKYLTDNLAYSKGEKVCYEAKGKGMFAYFLKAKGVDVEFIEKSELGGNATKVTKSSDSNPIFSYRFPEYGTVMVTIKEDNVDFSVNAIVPTQCDENIFLDTRSYSQTTIGSDTDGGKLKNSCIFLGAAPSLKTTLTFYKTNATFYSIENDQEVAEVINENEVRINKVYNGYLRIDNVPFGGRVTIFQEKYEQIPDDKFVTSGFVNVNGPTYFGDVPHPVPTATATQSQKTTSDDASKATKNPKIGLTITIGIACVVVVIFIVAAIIFTNRKSSGYVQVPKGDLL